MNSIDSIVILTPLYISIVYKQNNNSFVKKDFLENVIKVNSLKQPKTKSYGLRKKVNLWWKTVCKKRGLFQGVPPPPPNTFCTPSNRARAIT